MQEKLDELAKAIARVMSRRQAAQRLLGGAVAVLAANLLYERGVQADNDGPELQQETQQLPLLPRLPTPNRTPTSRVTPTPRINLTPSPTPRPARTPAPNATRTPTPISGSPAPVVNGGGGTGAVVNTASASETDSFETPFNDTAIELSNPTEAPESNQSSNDD
jgi:hypothetical protein